MALGCPPEDDRKTPLLECPIHEKSKLILTWKCLLAGFHSPERCYGGSQRRKVILSLNQPSHPASYNNDCPQKTCPLWHDCHESNQPLSDYKMESIYGTVTEIKNLWLNSPKTLEESLATITLLNEHGMKSTPNDLYLYPQINASLSPQQRSLE